MALSIPELTYVRDRLDRGYITRVAEDVAEAIVRDKAIEVAYQPGDGTRYALVFTPAKHPVTAREREEGYDRRAIIGLKEANWPVLVSYVEHGAYPFDLFYPPAWPYVNEKLGVNNTASAVALAVLLEAVSLRLNPPEPGTDPLAIRSKLRPLETDELP